MNQSDSLYRREHSLFVPHYTWRAPVCFFEIILKLSGAISKFRAGIFAEQSQKIIPALQLSVVWDKQGMLPYRKPELEEAHYQAGAWEQEKAGN